MIATLRRPALLGALTLALFLAAAPAQGAESGPEDLAALADGQRPATAALQKLIDSSEGLVSIPAGAFLLDAPLVVNLPNSGYRSITGSGGATRLVAAFAGPAIRIQGDHQGTAMPGSVEQHTWDRERMPIVGDLEILGAHEEADGIELVRTMKCIIRNVLIRKCRYGIHLVERNRNIVIAGSHIYDGGDTGIFLDNCNLHQFNITGNHISYNKRAGIRQFNGDVHNVHIVGNDIEYNSGSAESSGEIVLEAHEAAVSEYTIAGNTIQARPENAGANILIAGGVKDAPHTATLIAITGNVIGDRDTNIALTRASKVTIAGNTVYGGKSLNLRLLHCSSIVVDGNTIGTRPSKYAQHDLHTDGILLENCTGCLLSDNIVSEHRYGDANRGGAITLLDSRGCRISGCQISNPGFRGVHVAGGADCVVSDNSVSAPAASTLCAAIQVSDGGRGHLVQNNWISTALRRPIALAPGTAKSRNNTLVRATQTVETPAKAP